MLYTHYIHIIKVLKKEVPTREIDLGREKKKPNRRPLARGDRHVCPNFFPPPGPEETHILSPKRIYDHINNGIEVPQEREKSGKSKWALLTSVRIIKHLPLNNGC